jgi:hypothetical protein
VQHAAVSVSLRYRLHLFLRCLFFCSTAFLSFCKIQKKVQRTGTSNALERATRNAQRAGLRNALEYKMRWNE